MTIDANDLLGFCWLWHAVSVWLIAAALARAAAGANGSPIVWRRSRYWFAFRRRTPRRFGYPVVLWPIAGRWLLTMFFFMLAAMLTDVAHRAVNRNILTAHPVDSVTWGMAATRALPLFIEPWVFYRLVTRGLVWDPRKP